MADKIYTKEELDATIIRESSFNAVVGKDVVKDNEKNNADAVKQTADQVKPYVKPEGKKEPEVNKDAAGGDNRGMDNLLYDRNNEKHEKDAAAQLKGFDNAMHEKLHKDEELGNGTRGTDDDVKRSQEKSEEYKDEKERRQKQGLVGQTNPEDTVSKKTTMTSEAKVKRIRFKNTVFMSESTMQKCIPDDFKQKGLRFEMIDKIGNEFLVEWNGVEAEVISHHNKKALDESMERMKQLMNYSQSDAARRRSNASRVNEEKVVNDMFATTRKLNG